MRHPMSIAITRRLIYSAAVLALALGATVATTPAPASAAISSITCQGWTHVTFDPGLSNIPQYIEVAGDVDLNVSDQYSKTGACVATGSEATAGELDQEGLTYDSCTTIFAYSGDVTYVWNDGQSSTVHQPSITVIRGESTTELIATGPVISGEFQGDQTTTTYTGPNADFLPCLTTGVTSLDLVTTLTVLPL